MQSDNSTKRPGGQDAGGNNYDHVKIVVSVADVEMMRRIEHFIVGYDGYDLMRDIELSFPGASYRAFYLAISRVRDGLRWLEPEGRA